MRQAVQDGTGESLSSKNLRPLIKRQVGRDDDARSFIRGRDDIEEQFTAELACRDVTQFVQDQQVQRSQSPFKPLQCSFIPRNTPKRGVNVLLCNSRANSSGWRLKKVTRINAYRPDCFLTIFTR